MPILKKQETKELIFPDSGAKVTVISTITYGTMLKIWEVPNEDNGSMLAIACSLIVDWDFTDEKGVKLPITCDNLKNISQIDGQFLVSEVSKYFGEKKTSN